MKNIRIISILVLCLMAVTVNAGEIWWAGVGSDYGTAANWGGGVLPDPNDQACINDTASPYPILSSGSYEVDSLYNGYWGDGGMTINGGDLTVDGVLAVGYKGVGAPTVSNASLTMNGGYLSSLYQLVGFSDDAAYPNDGTLTINGGTNDIFFRFDIGGGAGDTTGQVNLNSGIMNVGIFATFDMNAASNITIDGGATLNIGAADQTSKVSGFVENGQITAAAGKKLSITLNQTAAVAITAINDVITDPNQMTEYWWGTAWQTPAGGDGRWGFGGNWGWGYAPTGENNVFINDSGDATPSLPVVSTGSQIANNIAIGTWSTGELTVSGGSLLSNNNIDVGYQGDGTLNISGGDVTVGGLIKLGWKGTGASGTGQFDMTGGNLNIGGSIDIGMASDSYGIFNFDEGIIDSASAWNSAIYVGRYGPGEMTMNGGTANLSGVLAVSPGDYDSTFTMNGGAITGAPGMNGEARVPQVWVAYNGGPALYSHGTLDMYGGTIDSAWAFRVGHSPYSTGVVNLYGGTITEDSGPGFFVDLGSKVNITGGQLVLLNTWDDIDAVYTTLTGYAGDGRLVAYDGVAGGVLHIDKDVPASGNITVWAENLVPQAKASNPEPGSGGSAFAPVTLQWMQGIAADTQDIYLGFDAVDVNEATPISSEWKVNVAGSVDSYVPDVVMGETYFWRVDTVHADTSVVHGDVWSFTVEDYIVLEDSESYDGTLANWSVSGGGAGVVLDTDTSDLGDQWGYQYGQAVAFSYNNGPGDADQAIYTLPVAFDATKYGSASLQLSIHGDAANIGALEPVYVILEDGDGDQSAAVSYNGSEVNEDLVQENWELWYTWHAALNDFAAVGFDLNNVAKVIVKAGPGITASGKITIDDIRIYPQRCVLSPDELLPGDFTYDCQVDLDDIEALARDWMMDTETVTAVAPSVGPILHYAFDETSGPLAYDSIGVNNGTLNSGSWVAGGGPGGSNCIDIDGGRTSGSYGVSVPVSVFSGITDTISFSVWVKGDASLPVSPTGDIFCGASTTGIWDGGDVSAKVFFQCPYETGYVGFGSGMTSPSSYDLVTWYDSYVDDWRGVWVHYTCVKDGAAGTMAIYRDGELVANVIEDATKPISDINYFWVGATQQFGYEGMIDDFRIYDYALSQEEAISLAGKANVSQPILGWRADSSGDGKVNLVDFADVASSWLAGELLWPRN